MHRCPRRRFAERLGALAIVGSVLGAGIPLGAAAAEPLPEAALVGAPPHSTPAPARPSQGRSPLLPNWARTYDTSGAREVWLLPVYDVGEPSWDDSTLLRDINRDLAWFGVASRGRFTMAATKVLDALSFDSARGSSCDAAARILAPAISAFYAEAPADVHLVVLTRSSDCPYSAIGDTPGRSLILTGFSVGSAGSGQTLLHELGHNLGLPHSAGYAGGLLSSTPTAGRLTEEVFQYGALTDVMGGHGAVARLSAAELAALGWGEGVTSVPNDIADTYQVTVPEVSARGADAAVVDDPVSGIRYSFTYIDAPTQRAAGVPIAGRGIFLHEVRQGDGTPDDPGHLSFSYWLPWEGYASGSSMGIGAGRGTHWISPTGAVAMTVRTMNTGAARIEVSIDPRGGLTDRVGPTWPLAPSIDAPAGSAVATLTLPAAWDQSGVTGYKVSAKGAEVLSVRQPSDLVFAGSAIIALHRPTAQIKVVAFDGAGNSRTWTQRVTTS